MIQLMNPKLAATYAHRLSDEVNAWVVQISMLIANKERDRSSGRFGRSVETAVNAEQEEAAFQKVFDTLQTIQRKTVELHEVVGLSEEEYGPILWAQAVTEVIEEEKEKRDMYEEDDDVH